MEHRLLMFVLRSMLCLELLRADVVIAQWWHALEIRLFVSSASLDRPHILSSRVKHLKSRWTYYHPLYYLIIHYSTSTSFLSADQSLCRRLSVIVQPRSVRRRAKHLDCGASHRMEKTFCVVLGSAGSTARVALTDGSPDACALARHNAQQNGLSTRVSAEELTWGGDVKAACAAIGGSPNLMCPPRVEPLEPASLLATTLVVSAN